MSWPGGLDRTAGAPAPRREAAPPSHNWELSGDGARKDVTSQAHVKVAIYKQVIARVTTQLSLRQHRILLFISPPFACCSKARSCQRAPPRYGARPGCAAQQLPVGRGLCRRRRGSPVTPAWVPLSGFRTGSCPGMGLPRAAPDAPDHTRVREQTPHTCKYLCVVLFDGLNNWLFTDGKG